MATLNAGVWKDPLGPGQRIGQSISGGYGWLQVERFAASPASLPLDEIRRPRDTRSGNWRRRRNAGRVARIAALRLSTL